VLGVVRSVRKFYPEAPIHLLSDGGGVDFGGVCEPNSDGCCSSAGIDLIPCSRWDPFHSGTEANLISQMRRIPI